MPGEEAAPPPLLLRLEEIEQKPKEVILVQGFADRIGLHKLPQQFSDDFLALRKRIVAGQPLPSSFYRKGKGKYDDEALLQYGVMHIHLGGPASDVLVFLFQFPEHVVFLEITDHTPFGDRPPGRSLRNRWYASAITSIAKAAVARREAAEQKASVVKAKNADIRSRLGLPMKTDRDETGDRS